MHNDTIAILDLDIRETTAALLALDNSGEPSPEARRLSLRLVALRSYRMRLIRDMQTFAAGAR